MAKGKKGEAPDPLAEKASAETVQDLTPAGGSEPADDHITAHDRAIERLQRIAEEAAFESGSLVGDIRDALLDLFRARPKPWSQMSAGEQADTNRTLEQMAKNLLRKLVIVLAEEEDVSIHATLKGYAVDGETFKLKVQAKGDEQTATELFRMDGHEIILIRADARRHFGQRRDAEVVPDQPELGFESSSLPPPPDDDSDLAEAGGEEQPNADDRFGVYDEENSLWLIDEDGGADGWTDHVPDAGLWTFQEAKVLAAMHSAEDGSPAVARALPKVDA